jgi:hypothetical protein
MRATLGDIERLLTKEGTAFIRGLLQSSIDARCAAEQPVEVVGADGVARPHMRTSTRTVETPFGEGTRAYTRITLRGRCRAEPAAAVASAPEDRQVIGIVLVERALKEPHPTDFSATDPCRSPPYRKPTASCT